MMFRNGINEYFAKRTDIDCYSHRTRGKYAADVYAKRLEMNGGYMKKEMKKEMTEPLNVNQNRPPALPEMRAEYDLASMKGGVRGKYYKAYRTGHTVKIQQTDGTTLVQHFNLDEGTVVLDPDVGKYFPDSESVNNTLRALIALIPSKPKLVPS